MYSCRLGLINQSLFTFLAVSGVPFLSKPGDRKVNREKAKQNAIAKGYNIQESRISLLFWRPRVAYPPPKKEASEEKVCRCRWFLFQEDICFPNQRWALIIISCCWYFRPSIFRCIYIIKLPCYLMDLCSRWTFLFNVSLTHFKQR